MDPPFAWNCQVVAGAGVVEDVQQLYHDMHAYLAGLHLIITHLQDHVCTALLHSVTYRKSQDRGSTVDCPRCMSEDLCRLCRTAQGMG